MACAIVDHTPFTTPLCAAVSIAGVPGVEIADARWPKPSGGLFEELEPDAATGSREGHGHPKQRGEAQLETHIRHNEMIVFVDLVDCAANPLETNTIEVAGRIARKIALSAGLPVCPTSQAALGLLVQKAHLLGREALVEQGHIVELPMEREAWRLGGHVAELQLIQV